MRETLRDILYLFLFPFALLYSEIEYTIWELRGEPCWNCRYSLKNVKFSESTMGLHKHCPRCGAITYYEAL